MGSARRCAMSISQLWLYCHHLDRPPTTDNKWWIAIDVLIGYIFIAIGFNFNWIDDVYVCIDFCIAHCNEGITIGI